MVAYLVAIIIPASIYFGLGMSSRMIAVMLLFGLAAASVVNWFFKAANERLFAPLGLGKLPTHFRKTRYKYIHSEPLCLLEYSSTNRNPYYQIKLNPYDKSNSKVVFITKKFDGSCEKKTLPIKIVRFETGHGTPEDKIYVAKIYSWENLALSVFPCKTTCEAHTLCVPE